MLLSATKLTTARTINEVSFNGSANITVADSTKLPLTGGTLTGDLTVNGGNIILGGAGRIQGIDTVSASTDAANKAYVDGTSFKTGMIILWSGSTSAIPSGWVLCNGSNNTPNLVDIFVVGAGSTYAVGATGGSANAVVVSHTHTASTDAQGSHTHTASTDSQGSHTHSQTLYNGGAVVSASGLFASSGNYDRPGTGTIAAAGSHSHNVGIGAAGSHGHNIAVSTNGESGTNKNLPPYYALCYIMKT